MTPISALEGYRNAPPDLAYLRARGTTRRNWRRRSSRNSCYDTGMPKSLSRRKKPGVAMAAIRRYARQIAERFHPDKIILFGSHAYGTPHADSDVDLLVIMPARNQLDQGLKIRLAFDPPFPLDIIVRKPDRWEWLLKESSSFSKEIAARGIVLYDKDDSPMGSKGRRRLRGGTGLARAKASIP